MPYMYKLNIEWDHSYKGDELKTETAIMEIPLKT